MNNVMLFSSEKQKAHIRFSMTSKHSMMAYLTDEIVEYINVNSGEHVAQEYDVEGLRIFLRKLTDNQINSKLQRPKTKLLAKYPLLLKRKFKHLWKHPVNIMDWYAFMYEDAKGRRTVEIVMPDLEECGRKEEPKQPDTSTQTLAEYILDNPQRRKDYIAGYMAGKEDRT